MPEISEDEYRELQTALAERDALKAAPPAPAAAEDAPPEPDHIALLADGTVHEYAGAHPTHVADGDRVIPVTGVYAKP
jgi:hypothetical protein